MNGNAYFGEGSNPDMSVCVIPRECRIWTQGNCRISFCNNENYEVCDSASSWGSRARAIEDGCDESTGGYQSPAPPADWTEVAIRLNTNWRLMSTATATSYKEITVEENKAELQTLMAEIDSSAAVSEANGLKNRVCTSALLRFLQKLNIPCSKRTGFQMSSRPTMYTSQEARSS